MSQNRIFSKRKKSGLEHQQVNIQELYTSIKL